ncbi:HXXEE domain-containing protein [Capnocytophaga sputigena]|uniref:HXXEE domain-containing protein n=1 Tax=Capnocytophaga sputigena TaxID=1019 RepID=A0A250F8X3_CAPSP|nr:HXXEE domain-containing protein [Capnocytophaga sputigena]ATA80508.1 HXXEE domain-containing protein [Capnocytophaga sputigena]
MQTNRYIHLWLPIMGLHALHQVEESISFWQWYINFVDKIPQWLQLPRIAENAHLANEHPEYFVWASIGQIAVVVPIAFLCRKSEKATRIALGIYLAGLTFFLVWYILISYFTHSYSPVMVTCFIGVYLIPKWGYQLFKR